MSCDAELLSPTKLHFAPPNPNPSQRTPLPQKTWQWVTVADRSALPEPTRCWRPTLHYPYWKCGQRSACLSCRNSTWIMFCLWVSTIRSCSMDSHTLWCTASSTSGRRYPTRSWIMPVSEAFVNDADCCPYIGMNSFASRLSLRGSPLCCRRCVPDRTGAGAGGACTWDTGWGCSIGAPGAESMVFLLAACSSFRATSSSPWDGMRAVRPMDSRTGSQGMQQSNEPEK